MTGVCGGARGPCRAAHVADHSLCNLCFSLVFSVYSAAKAVNRSWHV